jgi:hypothetical protein
MEWARTDRERSGRVHPKSRRLVAIGIVAAACGWAVRCPEAALGQPAGDKSSAKAKAETPKDRARALFEQGTQALESGDAKTAKEALSQAEELFHAPTTLLYLARAQVALGELLAARATYGKIVDEKLGPKASDAFKKAQKDAAEERTALDAKIPKLLVTTEPSAPPGLQVTMNGKPLEGIRLGELAEIDPGTYVFEAKADGLVSPKLTVNATPATTAEIKLVLQEVGKKLADQTVEVRTSSDGGWPAGKVASVPLLIAGGALLATGGVFVGLHFMKRADGDAAFEACPTCDEWQALDDQGTLFGNLGIGFLAGGGAAALSGLLMFVLIDGASDEAAAAPAVAVAPGVAGFPGSVGSTLTLRLP